MKLSYRGAIIISVLLCVPPAGFSQKKVLLPDDDPALFAAAILFVDDFGKWIEGRTSTASAARKDELTRSAARYFGIDEAGFRALIAASKKAANNIRAKQAEETAIARSFNDSKIPKQELLRLETLRTESFRSAKEDIRKAVSSDAWRRFAIYVNGKHRDGLQPVTVKSDSRAGIQSGH